jgi:hypothetical protein
MEPVDGLFAILDALDAGIYADSGMVQLGSGQRVAGRSFFPVGRGHLVGTPFPVGGIMVLGQDFGNERNVAAACDAGEETDDIPTWREIGKLFPSAGIPLEACWFTNYVMGVRPGRESNCAGRSPGLRRRALRRECTAFFRRQVKTQKPCAIVVLGSHLPSTLSHDVPEVFATWAGKSFRRRDANDNAVIRDAMIDGVHVPLVASIVHPSQRGRNVSSRRFGGFEGDEAERSILHLVSHALRERWGKDRG